MNKDSTEVQQNLCFLGKSNKTDVSPADDQEERGPHTNENRQRYM